MQRQLDDACAALGRERDRTATAEAHLTAFTAVLAAGGFTRDQPGDGGR
ncbi:hypothetical protein [Actinoplanes sp. NPDC049316]